VSARLEALALRLQPRPPYLALFAAAIQRGLTYRATRLLSVLTSAIVVAIQYVAWKAVFAARAEVGAFSWHEMQTYIALVFLINALLPADHELALYTRIRDGMVAVDLARPLDFQWSQLASASGAAVVELAFRGAALVLAGALLLDLSLPPSASSATLFAASLLLGFLARFLIAYMVALSCFWLLNVMGLQWMRAAITNVLSGAVVPITLFPGFLRDLAQLSPFAGMTFVPSSIYLGHLSGAAAVPAIASQIVWTALLWFAARRMWHLCARKLVVQGG
jgi:ABC-2 type transport system permease protein